MKLTKAVKEDLVEKGFFEKLFSVSFHERLFSFNTPLMSVSITAILILGLVTFISVVIFFIISKLIILVHVFLGLVLLILVLTYKRRTPLGYEALLHLKGFALYLSMTDSTRFDFHNAPEKSPELFMEYLPYAIALGVEEKWAKVFEDITIPQPEWFEGGSVRTFSATALASDIGSFSGSFSSSSGTSGSSGGGSSGGGGGGGGGGSW